ncbi:MAG: Hsp20/alpha crystallin family protein [Chloroflexota bacterium]|nr:Hsp20/alpha crystallin family protein [Chloroflexota bacterium]MDE2683844.1 Hsp20/alpha crystallin family protein [Chloroflexota bacterium]
MTMQRFDPFREMRRFNRLMSSPLWVGQRWGDPMEGDDDQPSDTWSIPMDVRRDDQALTVRASLPGFAAEDVDVSISPDRVLAVKASRQSEVTRESEEYLMRERRTGRFSRAIRLPSDLKLDDAAVALDNGVLTVTVPVAETAQTRRLHIAGGAASDSAASGSA